MPWAPKQRLQGMREAARKILLAKEENLSVLPLYDGDIISTGLTKREYFAAIALQGLLANSDLSGSMDSADEEYASNIANWYAKRAVRCADLLIAELNQDK